jgi:DNA gyrase inhibitor GyrI
MEMTTENIPSYKVAYVRRVGPYGADNVQTMEKLKQWARSNNLWNDKSVVLGIAQDNPETTKPENCRYDTCIVLENDVVLDDDSVCQGNLTGGKYAVFLIPHTAEAVQAAWAEIFSYLFSQAVQYDETRPILERYAVERVKNHYCEICVPIF